MHCPVCRASIDPSPQCRRCRADLTLLCRVEAEGSRLLAVCRRQLAAAEAEQALIAAQRAHQVQAGPESKRLLALAHLLRRDYFQAWRCYQAVR